MSKSTLEQAGLAATKLHHQLHPSIQQWGIGGSYQTAQNNITKEVDMHRLPIAIAALTILCSSCSTVPWDPLDPHDSCLGQELWVTGDPSVTSPDPKDWPTCFVLENTGAVPARIAFKTFQDEVMVSREIIMPGGRAAVRIGKEDVSFLLCADQKPPAPGIVKKYLPVKDLSDRYPGVPLL